MARDVLEEAVLVLAGATGGPINTGIAIFEAADEESARRTVARIRPPQVDTREVSSAVRDGTPARP